jgi:hypothetical protein
MPVRMSKVGLEGVTDMDTSSGGGGGGLAAQVNVVLAEMAPKAALTCTVPAETQLIAWVFVSVPTEAIAELLVVQVESLVTLVVSPFERFAIAVKPRDVLTC